LGHIALDGTKVKANASKHKTMGYGRMVTEGARLQAEVETVLKLAEAALKQVAHEARQTAGPRRGQPPQASLLKDEPRFRHAAHRDCHQFPSVCAELVQPGLHVPSIGKNFNDFVLKPFRLLCFRGEWLAKEQHESEGHKTDGCYCPSN